MIEPSKVLSCLRQTQLGSHQAKRQKRHNNLLYVPEPLRNVVDSLYNPPLPAAPKAKRPHKPKVLKLKPTKLPLDFEYLNKVCADTKYFITPSEGGLDFINEALAVLEECLLELPNFAPKAPSSEDSEAHFNALFESFFAHMGRETYHLELDEKEAGSSGEPKHLTKPEFKCEEDRTLLKHLLASLVLAHNWALQLFNHTETAAAIAKAGAGDRDRLLNTALGLKEANRNYVFYSNLSQQLWDALKAKTKSVNAFVAEFVKKIAFIKNVADTEKVRDTHAQAYEPTAWNRLRAHLGAEGAGADAGRQSHEDKLNLIRKEMARRIEGRSKVDYLRRELDTANAELSQVENRNADVMGKLDSLRKQLSDLADSLKFEPVAPSKLTDSRKLQPQLLNLLTHLGNLTAANPLREASFKVVKDHNYSFQMALAAPRDLLFPSQEATKFAFPLVFHFYLEDARLRVAQAGGPRVTSA